MSLILARPEKKNALNTPMYRMLTAALEQASAQDAVHAVLLDAEGDDFCAGNDIGDLVTLGQTKAPLAQSEVFGFLRALASFDKPLVAAVRGRAVGIGTTLLLHCDLVYVAEVARLSTPFVDLGLVPEAASSLLLPARIGHARAFALFALGEVLDGRTAACYGLANAAVPAAQVSARAQAAAQRLAEQPPQSLRATRRLMRQPGRVLALIEAECRAFAERLASPAAQARFQAFIGRRRG
jgi:enoyl-CoA hydratase/carnithine racemase